MKTSNTAVCSTAQVDLFGQTPLVTLHNGVPMTSSLQVAQTFGKEHRRLLQDIRNLECSPKFKEHHFVQSFYIRDIEGRGQHKYPLYYMTRDGFTFLAMGFTGKIAAKFKEDYINAFNQMEQFIISQALDEKVLMADLKKRCEKLSGSLKSSVSRLSKETGLSVGYSDMPYGLSVYDGQSYEKNLDRMFVVLHNGLMDAWHVMFRNAQVEQDSKNLRTAVRNFVYLLREQFHIYE